MQAIFVISRFFENTRELAQVVVHDLGQRVTLIKGDEPLPHAARSLRMAARVWFEGIGPLLEACLKAPESWKLPPACLRVAADEVARLPLPDLWRVVSDLVVPSRAAAQAVRARMAARSESVTLDRPAMRIHIVGSDPLREIRGEAAAGEELVRLFNIIRKAPGQLVRESWDAIGAVAEHCRGRVLVVGDAPEELRQHLVDSCGMEMVTGTASSDPVPADSVVFWESFDALLLDDTWMLSSAPPVRT